MRKIASSSDYRAVTVLGLLFRTLVSTGTLGVSESSRRSALNNLAEDCNDIEVSCTTSGSGCPEDIDV